MGFFDGFELDRVGVGGRRWPALFDAVATIAPAAAGELHAATPVGPVRGWPGVPSQRRRATGPGWALVGDAGYYKDPLGTHGITQALRDAQLLADAVLGASAGATALPAALASWEQTRDHLSGPMFAPTDALASYAWDGATAETLLRRLAAATSAEADVMASGTMRPEQARTA